MKLKEAARRLGCNKQQLTTNATNDGRWGEFLQISGKHSGSGNFIEYHPIDLVVLQMLLDTEGYPRHVRHRFAEDIYSRQNEQPAEIGYESLNERIYVFYRPHWSHLDS